MPLIGSKADLCGVEGPATVEDGAGLLMGMLTELLFFALRALEALS